MRNFVTFILFLCFSITSISAPDAQAESTYEYPELQVAPLASERLAQESKQSRGLFQYAPIQVSALSTLASGLLHAPRGHTRADGTKEDLSSGLPGLIVGGAWLTLSFVLPGVYHPYASELERIRALPSKTKREQLVRERAAEEAIDAAARIEKRLAWISALSNLTVNLILLDRSDKNDGVSTGISAAAAVAALSPLVFKSRAIQVARDQENYKRRIYGPLTSISPGALFGASHSRSASFFPGLTLQLSF